MSAELPRGATPNPFESAAFLIRGIQLTTSNNTNRPIKEDVSRLSGLGLNQREIAMALGCPVETVKMHLREQAEETAGAKTGRFSSLIIVFFLTPFVLVTALTAYSTGIDVLLQLNTTWLQGSGRVLSTDIFPDRPSECSDGFDDQQIPWEIWVCFEFEAAGKTYKGYYNHTETSPIATAWRLSDTKYELGAPITLHYDPKDPDRVYAHRSPGTRIFHLVSFLCNVVGRFRSALSRLLLCGPCSFAIYEAEFMNRKSSFRRNVIPTLWRI